MQTKVDETIQALALRKGDKRVFMPGSLILFREGKEVLLVETGIAKQYDLERERVDRLVLPGEMLGGTSLFLSGQVEGSAEAVTKLEARVLDIPKEMELSTDREKAEVLTLLCQAASARSYQEMIRLASFRALTPLDRVMWFIATYQEGQAGGQGVDINVPLTAKEMGEVCGASRPTVWRAVSRIRSGQQ
jgi:CRP-like cAMP-binding protein